MRNKISQIYLQPNSQRFIILNHLAHNLLKILVIYAFIILVYPFYLYYQTHNKLITLHTEYKNIEQNLLHKQKQLVQLESTHIQQEANISDINLPIKQILEQTNANLENIYWNFAQQKSATLIFTQRAETVFNTINRLNQLTQINFKEITLSKLNNSSLIHCQLIFTVVNQEKK